VTLLEFGAISPAPDYEAADRVSGLASIRGEAWPQKLVAKRWIIATYMLPFRNGSLGLHAEKPLKHWSERGDLNSRPPVPQTAGCSANASTVCCAYYVLTGSFDSHVRCLISP
jgi:hypothetical protein